MAEKAKHGYGSLERVDQSIQSGVLDAFDVLFVTDSEGKPYVGWVNKDGKKEIVDPYSGVATLESSVNTKLDTKADTSAVEALESQLSEKVDASTVQAMIEEYSDSAIEVVEF